METLNKKIEPFVFISADEWKKQLEKNNAHIIEETGEHFIMGWNPKTCSNFAQTVEIHPVLRMNYMRPKIGSMKDWEEKTLRAKLEEHQTNNRAAN